MSTYSDTYIDKRKGTFFRTTFPQKIFIIKIIDVITKMFVFYLDKRTTSKLTDMPYPVLEVYKTLNKFDIRTKNISVDIFAI